MKQRACPVSGARANNEQRPMECSGARSAGGEHTWSQLCFIKRQRSRESQRTLTCVPPQSCPRRSQDVAFGCAHSPYCGRWARRIADGVDGRRRRRRGTPSDAEENRQDSSQGSVFCVHLYAWNTSLLERTWLHAPRRHMSRCRRARPKLIPVWRLAE